MGLAEAAKACGVSVSTLRRKRDQLKELGAAQTASGWQIPVTALIGAGLMERVTPPPTHDTPDDGVKGELEALRLALAEAERRAAVAEAIATERERIIQTQAMALRMLEAGGKTTEAKVEPEPTTAVTEVPPAPTSTFTTSTRASAPLRLWRRLRSER